MLAGTGDVVVREGMGQWRGSREGQIWAQRGRNGCRVAAMAHTGSHPLFSKPSCPFLLMKLRLTLAKELGHISKGIHCRAEGLQKDKGI